MRPITRYYQAQTPLGSSTSPTPVTDNDATVHLHERWELVVYYSLCPILVLFFFCQGMRKYPCSPISLPALNMERASYNPPFDPPARALLPFPQQIRV